MPQDLIDIIAGFIASLWTIPIIFAIEWKAPDILTWAAFVLPVTAFLGALSIFTLILFGVWDGIGSVGDGPRNLAMRVTILIGIFAGAAFGNYIIKPLIYKIYRSLD